MLNLKRKGLQPLASWNFLALCKQTQSFATYKCHRFREIRKRKYSQHKTGAIIAFPGAWSIYLSYLYINKGDYSRNFPRQKDMSQGDWVYLY